MVLDLDSMYGSKYMVERDDSYAHEKDDVRKENEAWYWEIRGKYGVVYPCSETHLAVGFKSGRGGNERAKTLCEAAKGQAKLAQAGEDMTVYRVPNALAGKAIRAIKGKRRRHLDEAVVAEKRELLKKAREAKKAHSELIKSRVIQSNSSDSGAGQGPISFIVVGPSISENSGITAEGAL